MDREGEQFFPERGIVKKTIIVMLRIVVCVPNYRNGIDQENFYLHKKAEIAGKRDRKIHIRYELCWKFYPY